MKRFNLKVKTDNYPSLPSLLTVLLLAFQLAAGQSEEDKTWDFLDRTSIGLKMGLNFPSMSYSDKDLDGYSSEIYWKGLFEIFGEYMIIPSLSVRPGVKFLTRGQHIEEGFSYEFDAKYTEITLPVAYTFQVSAVQPYLLGGPVLGIARGGDVRYWPEYGNVSYKTKISKSSLSSYAFGLYLGAGVKYPVSIKEFTVIPGFEIGYHLGISNTYGDKEISKEADALNAYLYDISGERSNRGLELGITLAIPLGNFKKKPKAPEPVPEPLPEPVPEPEPEKQCYTIDEMKELIRNKRDIQGKKICAVKQVSFTTGSHVLTAEDKVYLDEMVILMRTNDLLKIRVNGHTDNVGDDGFNTNLSRERAKAVHDYLKANGIDASRLSFTYYGPTRPIADNDTEEGRAINRRVEFEIINQ